MPKEVPITKFNEMCSDNSCATLMENRASAVFTVEGKQYVISGSMSKGQKYECCWGYECIPLALFKGEPKDYDFVGSYKHQGFSVKGKKYVVISEKSLKFIPSNEGLQASLF